jgi:hypothetical protein
LIVNGSNIMAPSRGSRVAADAGIRNPHPTLCDRERFL